MPLVAVDQRGPHAGVEGADDVRFRLVADVEAVSGIDPQRLQGGLDRCGCPVSRPRSARR